jgi:PKD repeat protein
MPNPYLPTSPAFNYNDYELTIFKPDMVLTHEQLNTLFGFLLGEERRTRTRLIGIGVVCGLAVKLNADKSIAVSRGCGVTSEGDLICLETDRTYTGFLPYTLSEHAPYAPFSAITRLELWELMPPEFTSTDTATPLSTLPNLSDLVVMLYLESQVKDADACTGVACDNKGDLFNNRLHVLLTKRADAAALIEATHQEAMMACSRLPTAPSRRVGLDSLPYTISFNRFKTFIQHTGASFSKNIETAYALVKAVLAAEYNTVSPIPQWQKVLQDKIAAYNTSPNIQYLYDWLKDLFDAYNEFREATCEWLVACAPPETAFPKHLLLGEFGTGCPPPQYRHRFIQSPTIGTDAKQKALWLFDRIGRLIEGFNVPDLRRVVGAPLFTKITPSATRKAALGSRSMPFYYKPDIKQYWSYEKTRSCRTSDILSFHLPASPAPHVANPFTFDIEKMLFYRIEGFLNENLIDVLTNIQELRAHHNLSFDIVALRADAQQQLFMADGLFSFPDLEREFDDVLDEIRCLINMLTKQTMGTVGGTATTVSSGLSKAVLNQNPKMTAYLKRAVYYIDNVAVGAKLAPPSSNDAENITFLRMNYVEFSKAFTALKTALQPRLPKTTVDCIMEKINTLDKIKLRYDGRIKEIQDGLTFGNYLRKHPGMEHAAGVPRGGTFIVVYQSTIQKLGANNNLAAFAVQRINRMTYTVVADFYLPYLCCGEGSSINIQLPEPPPGISLAQTRVCMSNTPIPITVSPEGGKITDEKGNEITNGTYTPSVSGTHTLTYSLNGKTATETLTVLPLPVAQFNFEQIGNTLRISLFNQSQDATSVTWDFGDGSTPVTIVLSATVNGNIEHTYIVPDRTIDRKFTVVLTASNGICGDSIKKELVFQAVVPIQLQLDPLLCFNTDKSIQVKASLSGGVFKSESLDIDKVKGAFRPNVSGAHKIIYQLDGQEVSIETFILPNDFTIENPRRDKKNLRAIVEVVVLKPSKDVSYLWRFEGAGQDTDVKAFTETIEKENTRYSLGLPLDIQGGTIILMFEKDICAKISRSFEIKG